MSPAGSADDTPKQKPNSRWVEPADDDVKHSGRAGRALMDLFAVAAVAAVGLLIVRSGFYEAPQAVIDAQPATLSEGQATAAAPIADAGTTSDKKDESRLPGSGGTITADLKASSGYGPKNLRTVLIRVDGTMVSTAELDAESESNAADNQWETTASSATDDRKHALVTSNATIAPISDATERPPATPPTEQPSPAASAAAANDPAAQMDSPAAAPRIISMIPPSPERERPPTNEPPGNANTGSASPPDAVLLSDISNYLNSFRTMEGDFVQIGPRGEQSQGTFVISKPGKIRFRFKPPARLDVISDGRSVAVRDLGAQTQDLYPLSETPLRYLLAENIDLTSSVTVDGISQDADLVTLVLAERSSRLHGKLTLIFDRQTYALRQWVVTDAQGANTSIAISNTVTGSEPDPDLFQIRLSPESARL
jgi:outer membrane lipoprotein-sorting protein